MVVQYPGADGRVCDYTDLCKEAHNNQLMVTAVCDLLSLAVLKEPAAWGADIAAGCAQRFGLPMGFGGPTAGYIACSDEYRRNLPGRIVGISKTGWETRPTAWPCKQGNSTSNANVPLPTSVRPQP